MRSLIRKIRIWKARRRIALSYRHLQNILADADDILVLYAKTDSRDIQREMINYLFAMKDRAKEIWDNLDAVEGILKNRRSEDES